MYISIVIISFLFICCVFCFLLFKLLISEKKNKELAKELTSLNKQHLSLSEENDAMRKKVLAMQDSQDSMNEQVQSQVRDKQKEYKSKLDQALIELEQIKRKNVALQKKLRSQFTSDNTEAPKMDRLKQDMYGVADIKADAKEDPPIENISADKGETPDKNMKIDIKLETEEDKEDDKNE